MTARTLPDAPGRTAASGPARPATPAARLAATAHHASLLLAYPALLWLGRDMWFRLDEWNIVLGHSPGDARWYDVFAPFDVHWSTVLVLFYRGVGHFAGASQYLPYMGITLAVFVVSVHMAWRVLRRCGADPWVCTLLAAALLVLGAGWESMYWVLILGYTLPLALIFGAVLLADREELHGRHRVGIAVLTLVAVMCTGAGVAMVVVPFVVVALRRGLRDGLSVVAPAALVYAIWLALAGSGILQHPGGANRDDLGQVARFVWDGMSGSVSTLVGPVLLGAVGFVAVAVWMAGRWRRIGMPAPVPACAAGAVAMFLLTAVGRANGGDAVLPHYIATGATLLMPAVALAITDLLRAVRRPARLAYIVVVAGLCVVIAHNAVSLVDNAHAAAAADQESRRIILAAAAVSAHHEALPDSYPEPILAWAVSAADIARLRASGDLQPPASLPADLEAEVTLRLHVAVARASGPQGVDENGPPLVTTAVGATLSDDDTCATARSTGSSPFTVAVHFETRGSLMIVPVTPVELIPYLRGDLDSPSDEVQPTLFLAPGDTRYLIDIQPRTTPLLRFSAGTVRLCG